MSVPMWEQGSAPRVQSRPRAFLGSVLTLLLATAAHADEIARNETSFAKTKPGQVLNVSIHYKTARFSDVAAVSPEAAPVNAAAADGVQPKELAAALRFAKADDEAGRALPSIAALQRVADVAIYDIEGGKVYLPNGETLEAHSGIGSMRDNPAFVDRRNRGPTPPHLYDLQLRERPFLGVEAIRLTPAGGDAAVFGRVGFLAHTYMMRRRGDSNGCLVFKEYHRFLAAFKKGEIKRLLVVPRLREAPASILTALTAAKNS